MSHPAGTPALPEFEIDNPEEYSQYFLRTSREVAFYLNLLAKKNSLVTAHIGDGSQFFLTSIVAFDPASGSLLLDPAQNEALNAAALATTPITLVANLDRVKVQIRLLALSETLYEGHRVLKAPSPTTMLRLQRREFFRLEPPVTHPIFCGVTIENAQGTRKTAELKVADISGGGISLYAPTELSDDCLPDAMFHDCRLDIPGEGVMTITLRVRKSVELSSQSGLHILRVGCEFVGLSGARQAMVERYITRIERERKARESGIAD